ncbi:TIM barrel protein [Methanolobus psychrotolerans]|uniref:TIM barrel protein n=1 Tax=Methanolobus psychrotolerans TaxID=1874706 RepID=UPI000B915D1D|nr:TIM barrel protein [Methanolobus psychrotolerans]
MKELMNFSLYENDMKMFDSDWDKIRNFLVRHELDGLELFVDSSPLPDVPVDLIEGVHLPYWMGRHRAWADPSAFSQEMEEFEKVYVFGGSSREDVIDTFRMSLENAALLNASYAVFHVSYAELEQVFTRSFGCTDYDVLATTAEFLNEAVSIYPNGEPPVRIFFENLWWPGLTFLDPMNVEYFASRLDFDNWAFVLDTGHLMNATMRCEDEECSINLVLDLLSNHPEEFIRRIEGMHFHCSLSGQYLRNSSGNKLPMGFADMPFHDRLLSVMEVLEQMDQHMPFTSEKCSQIVEFVSPDFLTHEFVSTDLCSLDTKISTQKRALHS